MGRPKGSLNKSTLARMGMVGPAIHVDSRTDQEILDDILERFALFRTLIKESAQENGRCVAISGAPGVGKSYEIQRQIEAAKIPASIVSGSVSPVELYKLAWENRAPGRLVVLDDADTIMTDEEGVNLLKAMLDVGKSRFLSWRKQNRDLQAEGIDPFFEFRGSVIICSNLDWQSVINAGKSKYADHLNALLDRVLYLNLRIHDRRAVRIWITYVATRGHMFDAMGVSAGQGREFLAWMEENQDRLAQYSLRTLAKICEMKDHSDWQNRCRLTLFR